MNLLVPCIFFGLSLLCQCACFLRCVYIFGTSTYVRKALKPKRKKVEKKFNENPVQRGNVVVSKAHYHRCCLCACECAIHLWKYIQDRTIMQFRSTYENSVNLVYPFWLYPFLLIVCVYHEWHWIAPKSTSSYFRTIHRKQKSIQHSVRMSELKESFIFRNCLSFNLEAKPSKHSSRLGNETNAEKSLKSQRPSIHFL